MRRGDMGVRWIYALFCKIFCGLLLPDGVIVEQLPAKQAKLHEMASKHPLRYAKWQHRMKPWLLATTIIAVDPVLIWLLVSATSVTPIPLIATVAVFMVWVMKKVLDKHYGAR